MTGKVVHRCLAPMHDLTNEAHDTDDPSYARPMDIDTPAVRW